MFVARATASPAKNHADQSDATPFNRGNKVETRGVDISCLDAIGAGIGRQKLVMIAEFLAFPIETLGAEDIVILRKIPTHRDCQTGHVARRAALLAVGQSRGVAECGSAHAKRPRLARHSFGKFTLRAGQMFGNGGGNIICRLCDQRVDCVLHSDRLAGPKMQLRGRPAGGKAGYLDPAIHLQTARGQFLKHQIQRHDFCQRCRIPRAVSTAGKQHLAAVFLDHNGGVFCRHYRRRVDCAYQHGKHSQNHKFCPRGAVRRGFAEAHLCADVAR